MTLENFVLDSAPLVRHGDREVVNTSPSNRTGLVMDANATSGAVSVLSIHMAKGANGAAPHYHTRSTELFFVVSGRAEVLAGDHIEVVEEGDTILVPRLMPHAFAATPDSDASLFTVIAPGVQRFDYFRLLDRIVHGDADIEELHSDSVQELYDTYFVTSPVWEKGRGLSALDGESAADRS